MSWAPASRPSRHGPAGPTRRDAGAWTRRSPHAPGVPCAECPAPRESNAGCRGRRLAPRGMCTPNDRAPANAGSSSHRRARHPARHRARHPPRYTAIGASSKILLRYVRLRTVRDRPIGINYCLTDRCPRQGAFGDASREPLQRADAGKLERLRDPLAPIRAADKMAGGPETDQQTREASDGSIRRYSSPAETTSCKQSPDSERGQRTRLARHLCGQGFDPRTPQDRLGIPAHSE